MGLISLYTLQKKTFVNMKTVKKTVQNERKKKSF